jgi:hypothetical protein
MLLEIIQNEQGWPAEVVSLARDLYSMNTTYAGFAATFAHKLFTDQTKLGLDASDVVAALTEIATIIGVIEMNSDRAIKIVISNQLAPELGALPKEDA